MTDLNVTPSGTTKRWPLHLSQIIQVLLVIAAGMWAVTRTGPQFVDPGILQASLNWKDPSLDEGVIYIRSSPVGPLTLGGYSAVVYIWGHVFVLVTTIILLCSWVAKFGASRSRWSNIRIVLLSPIIAILLLSVGSYDAFTVIGIAGALWAWALRSKTLIFLSGIYLGFQHFEQAALLVIIWILAIYALTDFLPDRLNDWRRLVWLFPALFIGKIIQVVLFIVLDVPVFDGRSSVFLKWIEYGLVAGVTNIPSAIWAIFGGLWLLVFLALKNIKTPARRMSLVAAIFIAGLTSFTVIDTVRVFVIITLPMAMLLIAIGANTFEESKNSTLSKVGEALMWVGTPLPNRYPMMGKLHQFVIELRNS
jgi:hypothetical protein